MENETVHIDLVAYAAGMQLFLGHKDIEFDDGENPAKRFRQLASLMMQLAWEVEEKADKYENFVPRCFQTKLGDKWHEVVPDLFVDGEDYAEAQAFYAAGNPGVDLDQLRAMFSELKEV